MRAVLLGFERIPRLLRIAPAFAYVALVFLFGAVPVPQVTPDVEGGDKILHAAVFGGMVVVWLPALRALAPKLDWRALLAWAVSITVALGAALEGFQWFFPARSVEFGDWLADTAGAAALALAVAAFARWVGSRPVKADEDPT